MEISDLRPAILYDLYQKLKFNDSISQEKFDEAIGEAFLCQMGIDEIPEYAINTMELVAQSINQHVFKESKIELKYLSTEEAPEGYFEEMGKKLLSENYDSLHEISYRLINAMVMYHDAQVPKNSMGFKIDVIMKSPSCVESLPFYYGGIYLVKKYAIAYYSLLAQMKINVIDLDDNLNPIIGLELTEAVELACQNYIDDNMIFRFGHARREINSLPLSYFPLFPNNTPEELKSHAAKRDEIMKDDKCAGIIIQVVAKVNPVWPENCWIPKDDEDWTKE